MNLRDADQLARQLLQEHALHDWGFFWNRRKRALGLCRYERKRIELSLPFVLHNDEAAVRDTILHEIAHALAGPRAGHGSKWRKICVNIGAKPERCDHVAIMPRGRWIGTCPSCGKEYSRHRRPLKNRLYCCRHCGRERGRIQFFLAIGHDH